MKKKQTNQKNFSDLLTYTAWVSRQNMSRERKGASGIENTDVSVLSYTELLMIMCNYIAVHQSCFALLTSSLFRALNVIVSNGFTDHQFIENKITPPDLNPCGKHGSNDQL